MNRFVNSIIQFALFSVFLVIFLQIIISLRIKGKTIRGHDNLEQTSNINADLVFIGSSRCWTHFDPHFFDTTYKVKSVNIGVDGHSEISMAIIRLQDYLARNKTPKYVVYNFDPFVYAGSFIDNDNFVHKNDFARYAFFPKKIDLPVVDYFKFDCYEKYVPLFAIFKYKLLLNSIFLNNIDTWDMYGYEKHFEIWDTISKPITDSMKKYYFKQSEIPFITNSLNRLKNLCYLNNIKLLCVQTPVYKIIQDSAAFSETKRICNTLSLPFVDANKEFIRNEIKYFYNSNHLNQFGVAELNKVLKSDSIFSFFLNK